MNKLQQVTKFYRYYYIDDIKQISRNPRGINTFSN